MTFAPLFRRLSFIALGGLCLVPLGCSLAAYAGKFWWGFDMLAHFRPQLILAGGLGALLVRLTTQKRIGRWLSLAGLGCVLASIPPLQPSLCSTVAVASAARARLTIAHINVGAPVKNPDALLGVIQESAADIVFLQEIQPELVPHVRALDGYTTALMYPRSDTRGAAVFVKPGIDAEAARLLFPAAPSTERPTPALRVKRGSITFSILNASLPRPDGVYKAQEQHAVFRALGEEAAAEARSGRAPIVLGDCNATPWSVGPGLLQAVGGLHPAPLGLLAPGTWPAALPWPLRVAIDNAFLDPRISVTQFRRLSPTESDHLGIVIGIEM